MLVTDEMETKNDQCEFRPARAEDAAQIVAIYESVFGKNGVRSEGHEPYPAPEVFSIDGVMNILNDSQRQFLVAELDGSIAGGMIVSLNSRFHREFGCVCVGKKFQGRGISSSMLNYQKQLEKKSSIVINTTEIVTHSLLSQCAHRQAGYDKITGLGYLQYPRVFFPSHPESCLWITSLEGQIFDVLRSLRQTQAARDNAEVLNSKQRKLFDSLNQTRNLFLPDCYREPVTEIVAQFDDTLTFHVSSASQPPMINSTTNSRIELDLCGSAPYAYITFPVDELVDESVSIWQCVQKIRCARKRYVQARIAVNSPTALKHIELLRKRGFIFLGLAPLYQYEQDKGFSDVLLMQWIAPSVLASCGLPGETNCQAKLYGYPTSLVGDIVEAMRQDLAQGYGEKLFEDDSEFWQN